MFAWTRDLETGNSKIDAQHKELIAAINRLLDACSKGQGRTEIEGMLDFLNNYTIKHFSDEEALQQKYKYPDYPRHKTYHETFKGTVASLLGEFRKSGPTVALVGKLNTSVGGWLVNHIKKEDTKLAAHIKSCGG